MKVKCLPGFCNEIILYCSSIVQAVLILWLSFLECLFKVQRPCPCPNARSSLHFTHLTELLKLSEDDTSSMNPFSLSWLKRCSKVGAPLVNFAVVKMVAPVNQIPQNKFIFISRTYPKSTWKYRSLEKYEWSNYNHISCMKSNIVHHFWQVDVWFQNHRRRCKSGEYRPGQYSSSSGIQSVEQQ